MAKLQTFEGGLATRVAPHLISVNTGTVYRNIDNTTGELTPVYKEAEIGETLGEYAFYFEAESKWVSSATLVDYLEYQNALYKSDGITVPTRTVGLTTYLLGILAPTVAPTVAVGAVGVLTGTYQYVYTYYSSVTGAESAPSPLSAELVLTADRADLSAIVPSTDPQVTNIRIYRVGGNLSIFSLVDTIAAASIAYTDNIADTAIPGNDLRTEGFGQALAGASNIQENSNILFYSLGNNLYFSEIGLWYNWPATYFIAFDKPITGFSFTQVGILVFTKYRTYLVTGNSPAGFSRYLLSTTQGCKHYKTVASLDNSVLWVSEDGICVSSGNAPVVVSRQLVGKLNLQVTKALVHDAVYYAQLIDGSIFVMDTRYGTVFKDLSIGCTNLVVALDTLYGYFSGEYKELFAGTGKHELSWTSPVLLDGAYTERKNYNSIYVRHHGSVTITIYIGEAKAARVVLEGTGTYEIDVDQRYREGYSIQFVITGTGTVKEIEYQPGGNTRP